MMGIETNRKKQIPIYAYAVRLEDGALSILAEEGQVVASFFKDRIKSYGDIKNQGGGAELIDISSLLEYKILNSFKSLDCQPALRMPSHVSYPKEYLF